MEAFANLNADTTKELIFCFRDGTWHPSPQPGVARMPIDRLGVEVARATSLVRYDCNASFPEHTHGGGEEYYVFEGTFHDASGAAGKGMYVRNPIGSTHQPWTNADGAVIYVKLRWMTDTSEEKPLRVRVPAEGPAVEELYRNDKTLEIVSIERHDKGETWMDKNSIYGREILVLAGDISLVEGHGLFKDYGKADMCTSEPLVERDFIRIPAGKAENLQWQTKLGCRLLVKQGLV